MEVCKTVCVCVCLFFLSTHRLALVASVEVHKPLGLAYCGRRCKPMCSAIYYIVFYILYHILYNLLYFIYILYSSPRHLIPVLSWSHFLRFPGKEYEWVWGENTLGPRPGNECWNWMNEDGVKIGQNSNTKKILNKYFSYYQFGRFLNTWGMCKNVAPRNSLVQLKPTALNFEATNG